MTYHGTFFSFQPVQHTQKVYTIFWNPSGTSFPAGYQETINQFVQDLNGSPYYGIAGQYDDSQGPISTTLLYGGTWRDTTNAIPSAFLTSQSDQILEDEVKRAKAANGWPDDQNSYFQVYTPSNVKSPAGSKAYCGFHTYDENFFSPNLAFGLILYPSDVPADGSSPGGTCFVSSPWPNSMIIDSAITVSAHEIMETVTDPYGSGWYYLDGTGEIGDLCSFTFGFRDSQSGSNVLLNGHSYIIQKEWSNASSGCVIGSGGSTTPTLTTGSATSITPTSVILSATVNPNGASTTLYFDYGTTTSYGTTVTSGVVGSGTSAVTQSYNLSNLSCGTTYQYRARAQNSSGTTNGGNQTFTSGSCAATVVAPSGLSAVALSSSSIAVSWVDNSNNETGFNVYRWTGSSWAQIATVGANVTSYTDTGLQPSTTYYHTVCVQNNATSGCASTFSTTTTQGSSSSTTPAAPSGVTASALSSSSIRVSWVDNSNNETGFNVYRWTGSSWAQIAAVGANVTSYTDTGLQPSTTYYHTVCVQNNADSGCASTFSTATTQGSSSSTTPAAPSGVTASALSSSSIGVSWVDNSNNETGFTVYRWNGSSWAQIATVGANVTTYTDTGLQPSTTYYHTVCVQNDAGSSCASTFSTTTTQGSSSSTTPAAPSGVTASALSSSSIRVSWVDNSNNETGFNVYRWAGSSWAQIAAVGANVTSYTDTGLQPSTTYYHTVCVQNNADSGCASTFSTATTQGSGSSTTPAAPSGVTASALSSSSIGVSWVDNSNNETGFTVYRWTGSSWAQIATVGANVTTYTDTGLQPSTTYYHTVCVQNNAGSSCASTFSTTTTQGSSSSTTPAAPSGVTASALSSSSIEVSWVDNSNNETGFTVYRWTGSFWAQIATVGANVTSYTDTGLQASTTYYHTVCVQNNAGSSCANTFSTANTF